MKIRRACTIAVALLFPVASPAGSQVCDPCGQWSVLNSYAEAPTMTMVVCPKGDGVTPEPIDVYLLNNCDPIGGACPPRSAHNIYLLVSLACQAVYGEEGIHFYDNDRWIAASDTDPITGFTQITCSPCASGFVEAGHLTVYPIGTGLCLSGVSVRSPDIDLDGAVDVDDFAIFATYYLQAVDPDDLDSRRCDLDANGYIDTPDFAIFSQHYLHTSDDCGGGSCQ